MIDMNKQEKMAQPAKVSDATFLQLGLSYFQSDNIHPFNSFDKQSTKLRKMYDGIML